jgi:hypothetical protein
MEGCALMVENAGIFIALAVLLINTFGTVVAITRVIGKLEAAITEKIVAERKEIDRQYDDLRDAMHRRVEAVQRECDDRVLTAERSFGQTVLAIQTKVFQFEIWARDTFVQKQGFYRVRDDILSDFKALGAQITARLERMEGKVDAIAGLPRQPAE